MATGWLADGCLVLDTAADSECLGLDLGNMVFTVRFVEIRADGIWLRAGLLSLLLDLIHYSDTTVGRPSCFGRNFCDLCVTEIGFRPLLIWRQRSPGVATVLLQADSRIRSSALLT